MLHHFKSFSGLPELCTDAKSHNSALSASLRKRTDNDNFEKSFYVFFIPWEMHRKFFPLNTVHFQEKATASLEKAFNLTRHSRRSMVLAVWDMCSSFYVARAMIGSKKKWHWKRKKRLLGFGGKTFFFFRVFAVFALKMDKFLVTEQGMLIFLCKFNFFLYYRTESTHN